ncbi:GIY-YIG nuclease family protein [Ferrimonas aestuarii]|uniref:GIY-YIG nuclease family protein n=2 Tax=Ferrimonas aestuarii TaxID=2569539 RepID=A0A4U1BPI8_9GAMM|nr:GIY-YIG nuclease family protein [Ferrimonas aestuarii]
MERTPCVYMLSNHRNGTLYVGVTSNLHQRIWQHNNQFVDSFSKQHNLKLLVYFEAHQEMADALLCERQLKNWRRAWKIELIEASNPYWRDLWDDICC